MLRYAPPLERDLNVNDLRIALINYIVSRQRDEGFILRFEDMATDHRIEGKEQEQERLLQKFALQPDQTVYQSGHPARYQRLALQLLESKKAFLCICREEVLERERQEATRQNRPYGYSRHCLDLPPEEIARIKEEQIPFTIRLRKPSRPITFTDLLLQEQRSEPHEVDHFLLQRADGTPTEDFATAVDDLTEGISLVIRDERRLAPHTAREIYLRGALGMESGIAYLHLPTLRDTQGERLSPHDRSVTLIHLLEEGFLPDAIINYLLALGIDAPTEIFTLPEAVEWFKLKLLRAEPARFDIEELQRVNQEHLRRMDDLALSRIFRFADRDIGRLAKLYLEECGTIRELEERIATLFSPKKCEGPEGETMRKLSALIRRAPMLESFEEFEAYLAARSGLESEELRMPLRLLMTGSPKGPKLDKIYRSIKPYITEVAQCQP
jgi:glutamyl-tRNA synthetase